MMSLSTFLLFYYACYIFYPFKINLSDFFNKTKKQEIHKKYIVLNINNEETLLLL